MAIIFLDTSALIRRYDPREPGSERVRELCRRAAGNGLAIARATSVEVASALTRKCREGRFGALERDRHWRVFRGHVRDHYRGITLDDRILMRAEQLLFKYPLRAYDAVQLASAQQTRRFLLGLIPDFRFCTADRTQADAARREGLLVELIA